MGRKAQQLQIRVTAAEKATLRKLADRAGLGVSAFVLARALPDPRERFGELVGSVAGDDRRYALAELNDLLSSLTTAQLRESVAEADVSRLTPLDQNYVAAMVEQVCTRRGVQPPAWLGAIEPLAEPYFATRLAGLRLHLLGASPVPFKRRNIFVDSTVGDRV